MCAVLFFLSQMHSQTKTIRAVPVTLPYLIPHSPLPRPPISHLLSPPCPSSLWLLHEIEPLGLTRATCAQSHHLLVSLCPHGPLQGGPLYWTPADTFTGPQSLPAWLPFSLTPFPVGAHTVPGPASPITCPFFLVCPNTPICPLLPLLHSVCACALLTRSWVCLCVSQLLSAETPGDRVSEILPQHLAPRGRTANVC